jgi:hypothetical protein
MEDVLDVYTQPHDPEKPLVCLDETSKQLVAETRTPIPMKEGRPERVDYEYERNGTANLFMLFAPLEGWRHVEVTDRRTAIDYAKILKDLSDVHFPHAKRSFWYRTISIPMPKPRFTKLSRPPRPGGWSNASCGTTRPNMAVG